MKLDNIAVNNGFIVRKDKYIKIKRVTINISGFFMDSNWFFNFINIAGENLNENFH